MDWHRARPDVGREQVGPLYTADARSEYAGGNRDTADRYFTEGLALTEAYYDSLSQNSVAEAQAAFEVEQSAFAVEEERARSRFDAERAARERWYLIGGLALLGLLLAGAAYAYRRLSRSEAETQAANAALAASLTERETLLKEIHHRVKNNLQIISGLLYKQARTSVSEDVKNTLKDGQDRIQAMALVHQSLYQRDELSYINARDFVQELVEHLQRSQDRAEEVTVTTDAADETLDMDQAIPVGLILNELITNAFKYAFGEQRADARLNIAFERVDDGKAFELRVADNGRGLPPEFTEKSSKSLGMNLIRGLTRQLRGKWQISENPGGGTLATLRFATARPI